VETARHVLWDCVSAQDVWSDSKQVLQKSCFDGDNFMAANQLENVGVQIQPNTSYWSAPRIDSLKANWDASINAKEKLIGIGVIVRDEQSWKETRNKWFGLLKRRSRAAVHMGRLLMMPK
jgi:hypothetical protein